MPGYLLSRVPWGWAAEGSGKSAHLTLANLKGHSQGGTVSCGLGRGVSSTVLVQTVGGRAASVVSSPFQ